MLLLTHPEMLLTLYALNFKLVQFVINNKADI